MRSDERLRLGKRMQADYKKAASGNHDLYTLSHPYSLDVREKRAPASPLIIASAQVNGRERQSLHQQQQQQRRRGGVVARASRDDDRSRSGGDSAPVVLRDARRAIPSLDANTHTHKHTSSRTTRDRQPAVRVST